MACLRTRSKQARRRQDEAGNGLHTRYSKCPNGDRDGGHRGKAAEHHQVTTGPGLATELDGRR